MGGMTMDGCATLGVDFGTTTTLAARNDGPSSRTIPLGIGAPWMPTLAAVDRSLGLVVGERATAHAERSVVRSVKSRLGEGAQTVDVTTADGRQHTAQVDDVVCAILQEAATRIERASGVHVDGTKLRFGCPAMWTAEPRRRLADIAGDVGLGVDVADILDEPIAAGISWVMGRFVRGQPGARGRVVVFDCGGGTLDVAVLDVKDSSPPEITVLSAASLSAAGDALDKAIADDVAIDLQAAGFNVANHDRAPELQRLLRLACERLKVQLTAATVAATDVGGDFADLPTLRYERTRLEAAFADQLNASVRLVHACLRATQLHNRSGNDPRLVRSIDQEVLGRTVTHVLLVGGMSRVPVVAARLAGEFPDAVVEFDPSAGSPEESVVNGLTFDDVVSKLNLHRPGFDFVVRFTGSRGQVLGQDVVYSAYSPLYEPDQVVRGESLLGHDASLPVPAGAIRAELACVDVEGRSLELYVDDRRTNSVDVRAGARGTRLVFKIYANGEVLLRGDQMRKLRVERWPVLRSGLAGPTKIALRTVTHAQQDAPIPGWWHGGE